MNNSLIEIKRISKRFGSTIALNDVSFDMEAGHIIGLVGENGSGKSTLTSLIAGIQNQSSGNIFYQGDVWKPKSMIEASKKGMGMVVQENGTVPGITVAENIFLGDIARFSYTHNTPLKSISLINKKKMYKEANSALKRIGINHINVQMITGTLSLQDRKLIELAKVMYAEPKVLIIDETTTALSQNGRDILFKLIKQQKELNKLVIFISHDLDEVKNLCDQLVVLRDGELIVTLTGDEINEDTIKTSMIGRELKGHFYREDYTCSFEDEVVIEMKDVGYGEIVKNISFKLHKGEILGVGGLSHCGMHELGKISFGSIQPSKGKLNVKNSRIRNERDAMNLKLGYVAKDRDLESLNLEASIRDNIAVAGYDKFQKGKGIIIPSNEKKYVKKQMDSLSVKCRDMNQPVSDLSGGNKQKVVFGKWYGRDSQILILDCPTRGVDIGVKQAMYQLMTQMKLEGKSILMISEELPELIGMSDRIMIMKDGEIKKTFERSSALTEADIITHMV